MLSKVLNHHKYTCTCTHIHVGGVVQHIVLTLRDSERKLYYDILNILLYIFLTCIKHDMLLSSEGMATFTALAKN